jgi:hypothetical protein|tara:strand:+ start:4803 stop:5186 length:384 start_codon:yes stop_codon:yes gene_type:complete
MISINDIIKIDDKKKRIKKEIYTKIYEQFSSKIRKSVELNHKQVFLTVPIFLVGYPVYDRGAAAKYVLRQFQNGGFDVQLLSEFDIYVSWNTSKKKRESHKEVEDDADFPNLMNLKKIANQYRRNGA